MIDTDLKRVVLDGLGGIAPEANLAELRPDENVRRALDIDSYDFLNFLIGLHERLGIEIPEADYGKLNTLAEIMSYLSARIA